MVRGDSISSPVPGTAPLTRFQRGLSSATIDPLNWMDLVEGPCLVSGQCHVNRLGPPTYLSVSAPYCYVQSLTFTHDGERRVYHDGTQPISRRVS